MRTWAARLALLAVAVLAVAGLWRAVTAEPPRTLTEQTRSVAQTLRCPTCVGEDVADSAAPVAVAMREVIADQLADGRSPGQIRAWFAERYGDEVLLDPPRRGAGWMLWILPVALTGAAVLVLVLTRRRHAGMRGVRRLLLPAVAVGAVATVVLIASWQALGGADGRVPLAAEPRPLGATDVLVQAVAENSGDARLQTALGRTLEAEGRHAEAAEHYAAAVRLRPFDADAASLQARALLRTGEPEEATRVLDHVLAGQPEHAPTLLMLGTLRHRAGDERGTPLLERFLKLEPEHPAAPRVRALLDGSADGGQAGRAEAGRSTEPG